jgi:hypothetical protein
MPRFGYPRAVVGAAPFNAQEKNGLAGGDEYLTGAGAAAAHIVANAGGLRLRVSDDYNMAIEHSDLQARQPKAFYATPGVVTAANLSLTNARSGVQLQIGAQSITIWSDRVTQHTLFLVTPTYNGGNADQLPQNCNSIAAAIIGGNDQSTARLYDKTAEIAARLAPSARQAYQTAITDDLANDRVTDDALHLDRIAKEYVSSQKNTGKQQYGANRFAAPNVGEAFVIGTVGGGTPHPGGGQRVRDYRSGQNRILNWSFHFGGVVAMSGTDRVTLENFARGDNRQNNADPRWYFQMYGEHKGQSFHHANKSSSAFSNPLTVAVTPATPITSPDRVT